MTQELLVGRLLVGGPGVRGLSSEAFGLVRAIAYPAIGFDLPATEIPPEVAPEKRETHIIITIGISRILHIMRLMLENGHIVRLL